MASARRRRHSGGDGLHSAAALVAVTQVCPRVDSHSATVTRGQSRFCSVIFKVNI